MRSRTRDVDLAIAPASAVACCASVSSSCRIRDVRVSLLDIPLFVPFGISGGAQPAANNVLLEIELADGTRGWGEAAPLPPYNGETQADAFSALESFRKNWIGREIADWKQLALEFRAQAGGKCGSAQCALEMALIDAFSRRAGQPLWKFFGGAETILETDMTVTTGSVDDATIAAGDIRERGIRVVKVKVGGKSGPAHDVARIAAIRAVLPEAPLILDGNAGVSRSEASELVRGLKARDIVPAVVEQWLAKDDLAGMSALGRESGWTVAADESACSADDVRAIARAGAAQVVNIKLMKAGVIEALAIVDAARAAGIGLMIGGNVESILAMTFSANFAAGLGGFKFADLDTPLFLAENPFSGGYQLTGGMISVTHITAGNGVQPK